MAAISPYLGKQMLDFVAGGESATRPAERWLALGDETGNEFSFAGYSRRTCIFDAATGCTVSMLSPTTFGLTHSVDFAVRSIWIMDASVSGNQWGGNTCSVRCQANGAGFVVGRLAIVLT